MWAAEIEQTRENAEIRAGMHDGEDRRPARNRQRRDNVPERFNPTRRCRDHNNLHHAALTPLRPTMFLWLYCVRQLEEALRDSLSYHMPTAVLNSRAEPGVPAAFRGAARLFSAKMTAATQ